jgi:hypothetical protein
MLEIRIGCRQVVLEAAERDQGCGITDGARFFDDLIT